MIRLSTTQRPQAWTTIDVNLSGDLHPVRVCYWLLTTAEAARWSAERLQGMQAVRSDDPSGLTWLLGELSPEHLARVRALLMERILDWEIEDADRPGERLPVNETTVSAILDLGHFFRPLFQGLLDASAGAARKNG